MSEEKIEVGEYVKLDNGKIGKVIAIEKGSIMLDIVSNRWVGLCCITKHSFNIIDLIEVGDIVNGCEVMNIYKPRDIWEPIEIEINSKCTRCFLEGEIKTILTHELYKQNCYKVVE